MTRAKGLKSAVWMAFMGAVVFVPAGTLDWPNGWVFMAEMTPGATVLHIAVEEDRLRKGLPGYGD